MPREKTLVVFGVSGSKEVAAISRTVAARFDHFILTRAFKAGAEVAQFEPIFRAQATDITIATDTAEAARIARERAARDGLSVLAIGGLFLAAEVQREQRRAQQRRGECLGRRDRDLGPGAVSYTHLTLPTKRIV